MTTRNAFRFAAILTWAAAGIASATPADALVYTKTAGSIHASCSSNSGGGSGICNGQEFAYKQMIKFVTAGCGSGACASDVWKDVDFLYPTGRKTASFQNTCGIGSIWVLGSCSC
jgi:hypothetical protein